MIAILGAGISGISAAYHLQQKDFDCRIFEKREQWGGLCDNFIVGEGFRFDYFIHLSFTNNRYVQELFSLASDFYKHHPNSSNYYKGYWLKHPAQNNLFPLSVQEKIKIIVDFIKRPIIEEPPNYYDWLYTQYGKYFTENFPAAYTNKYWTIQAKDMTTNWLGNRFSLPPLEILLEGAFEDQQKNYYYAEEMRYPKLGGYKSFLTGMASQISIETNKEVILIDLKYKKILFSDNTSIYYDHLVSSIPLPDLLKRIKDVPKRILEASEKLLYTSGQLVSLGFCRPGIPQSMWFYLYDDDILPSRAYSPSNKSPDNTPVGKSSLQFETYFSKVSSKKLSDGSLIDHILTKGNHMKLWDTNDIEVTDYREVKYANVVFNNDRTKNLNIIHNYLKKVGVFFIGRFGEWDYLWSDQSLVSGKKCAEKLAREFRSI